ncbi:hypothetical protein CTAYLR_003980 [Chrysophaeum taylorii]|uniref:Tyrosinase copper-binding domain-containing protein n=1 Tax=Chrysophaeum taylorii TaxID=2483200 RepID=A0AAD7UG45_9STRA|nr:hypothetical protein CTAYLR_003980 [Chrysophaeum taylorii]
MTCDGPRVRRAWSSWRPEDQALWIEAVNKLAEQGHYWTFVALHHYNADYIHATSFLFPWHRIFVWEFENAIRAAAPEYACLTVPVWDWALLSSVLSSSANTTKWVDVDAFARDMGGPGTNESVAGLPHPNNGNGVTADQATIDRMNKIGGYAKCRNASSESLQYPVAKMPPPFHKFQDLTQSCSFAVEIVNCNCTFDDLAPLRTIHMVGKTDMFNVTAIRELVTHHPEYVRFYKEFTKPHAKVHGAVSGTMSSQRSPADPFFWGHHCMVDFIWDVWQRENYCDGRSYADTPTDEIDACPPNTIYDCVLCGNKLESDLNFGTQGGSYLGLFDGNYSDGLDNLLPFYGTKTPWAHFKQRHLLKKPPGVTNRTWYGTWTPRDVNSLKFWAEYEYDYSSISISNDHILQLKEEVPPSFFGFAFFLPGVFFFLMILASGLLLRRRRLLRSEKKTASILGGDGGPDERSGLLLFSSSDKPRYDHP